MSRRSKALPNRVIIRWSYNASSLRPFVVEARRHVREHKGRQSFTYHIVGRYPTEDAATAAMVRAAARNKAVGYNLKGLPVTNLGLLTLSPAFTTPCSTTHPSTKETP